MSESNFEKIETAVEGCSKCGLSRTYVTSRHKQRGELIRAIARWCGCPLEDLLVWSDSLAEVHAKAPKGRTV